jgi:hypothetical protein
MPDDTESQQQHTANGGQKQASESPKQIWNEAPPFPIAANPITWKVAVLTACECKTQLDAALAYARYGIPVFPCNWKPEKQEDGSYKVNKYPVKQLGKGGLYLATTDPIVIGARAGDGGIRRDRADAGPAVATDARPLEYAFADNVGSFAALLGRRRRRRRDRCWLRRRERRNAVQVGDHRVDVGRRHQAEAMVDCFAHRTSRRAAA